MSGINPFSLVRMRRQEEDERQDEIKRFQEKLKTWLTPEESRELERMVRKMARELALKLIEGLKKKR